MSIMKHATIVYLPKTVTVLATFMVGLENIIFTKIICYLVAPVGFLAFCFWERVVFWKVTYIKRTLKAK